MQLSVKLGRVLSELDADLRAGGFGANGRGLARDLYASLTATIIASRGTEAETTAWRIGHGLATDLYRAGARRGALALLTGLIEFASIQCHPEILATLTGAAEAIERKMGRHRRAAGRSYKVADKGPAAQDVGGEVAVPVHESETPTPIHVRSPDLPAPRPRSRRRGAIIATAAVLGGIALCLFVTHDGNLIQHSLSTPPSAAPGNAGVANAIASKAPTANVPKAISSPHTAVKSVPDMGTAAGATEKLAPQSVSRFLVPKEVRYAKANRKEPAADATRTASGSPETAAPLLDLETRDGAAAVQAKLKALGYYHHTVDGLWGPMSVAALSSFRQEKGLSSGGVWDLTAQSALLGK